MAGKGATFLNPALVDSVTHKSHDHRTLMDQINQGFLTHDATIANHAAEIAALKAQIAAMQAALQVKTK
jgi:hypothetical protein